jgi:hypothetical protein
MRPTNNTHVRPTRSNSPLAVAPPILWHPFCSKREDFLRLETPFDSEASRSGDHPKSSLFGGGGGINSASKFLALRPHLTRTTSGRPEAEAGNMELTAFHLSGTGQLGATVDLDLLLILVIDHPR